MALTLVSQSNFTGLSVTDVMLHLNVVDTSQELYISSLMDVAVSYCERFLGMDLRATNWLLTLGQFPLWAEQSWFDNWGNQVSAYPLIADFAIGRQYQRLQRIDLLRGPLQTVTQIQYYDGTNTLQTLDPSTYTYTTPTYEPGWLEPVVYWQVAYPRPDAVQISYVTGWVAPLPSQVLHAIRLLCGLFYSNRESNAYGGDSVAKQTFACADLLLGQMKRAYYA